MLIHCLNFSLYYSNLLRPAGVQLDTGSDGQTGPGQVL